MTAVDDTVPRPRIAVIVEAHAAALREAARTLANELGLPLTGPEVGPSDTFDLFLVVGERGLELRPSGRNAPGSVRVDFVGGATGYRRVSGTSRRQPIARAVGIHRGVRKVLDATAGLGRDAFLLACLGCSVTAIERSPILGAMFCDGLARATAHPDERLRDVIARINLVVDDARNILSELAEADRPDVVYLDPMYPERSKAALVKKEMRLCRQLVGDDPDASELLDLARRVARRRVVVKRHRLALPLAADVALRYDGRRARYDVYRPAD